MVERIPSRQAAKDLSFGLGYAVLLMLSLSLLHITSQTAVIWIVGGFLAGYLVITPTAQWGRRLGVAGLITLPLQVLWLGRPLPLVLVFFAVNALEAMVVAVGMRRYCGGVRGFHRMGQAVIFLEQWRCCLGSQVFRRRWR